MKINSKVRYGIRTMLELSLSYHLSGVMQKEIAESQEISIKYLDRILTQLKAAGLITKNKGRNGGYSLSRNPNKITVYDIYYAFENDLIINDCISDPENYLNKNFCSAVIFWNELNNLIIKRMKTETIESLTKKYIEINKKSEFLMYYI